MSKERTKEEQILVLETLIKERSLIIDNIQSKIGSTYGIPHIEGFNAALSEEIENHKLALQEYKEGLEKLNQKKKQ